MSTKKIMFPTSFIAFKYIKSRKYSYLPSLSFLTSFFGIFISVFALIATISIMEGFKVEFEKNIIGLRPHIKIFFLTDEGKIKPLLNVELQKEKLKNKVMFASGGITGEAIASNSNGNNLSGIILNAMEKQAFFERPLLKKGLSGTFEEDGIIIGNELAFKLGVKIGDYINLISPQFRKTPFGTIPVHKTLKVTGIFNVGMYFYDSSFAFLSLKQGEAFFQKNGVDFIEILTKNPNNLKEIEGEILNIFGGNIRITDWQTENRGFIQAISLQKSVMFFILSMFLILASFIMFSSLSALVMQKAKTTAILQTMGFDKKQVVLMFFQVGIFTSIPAIFFGILFGGIFVLKLEVLKNWLETTLNAKIFDGAYYFLSYIPSHLEIGTIIKVLSLSLVLCFVSILIPALRSIKTKPIDALRWE